MADSDSELPEWANQPILYICRSCGTTWHGSKLRAVWGGAGRTCGGRMEKLKDVERQIFLPSAASFVRATASIGKEPTTPATKAAP